MNLTSERPNLGHCPVSENHIHKVRHWYNGKGVSCFLCHKSWYNILIGYIDHYFFTFVPETEEARIKQEQINGCIRDLIDSNFRKNNETFSNNGS